MKYYRWVAIIDDKTCPQCLAMDGRVLNEQEIKTHPLLHGPNNKGEGGCRCGFIEVFRFMTRMGIVLGLRSEVENLGLAIIDSKIQGWFVMNFRFYRKYLAWRAIGNPK